MQRAARCFALMFVALTSVGCMDQMQHDQAMQAMEAARNEGAREGRLQALERQQAYLMQQIANLSAATNVGLAQASSKEDERDKQLTDISTRVNAVAQLVSSWREEERPQHIDPEARRLAEQTSAPDRAAAISKVQALIDAGQIKLLMRGGRIQLSPVRPIDVTNPYEPPPRKPLAIPAPKPAPIKRPVDRLGF